MALESFALTTVATVQLELPSISTARAERLINAASDAFCRLANRRFHYESNIVEQVASYGDVFLILTRVPIVAVDEVVYLGVNGVLTSSISDTEYRVDTVRGHLYKPSGWGWSAPLAVGIIPDLAIGWEDKGWRVTYDAGYVTPNQAGTRTLPWDIEQAVIESVISTYRLQARDPTIQSESYPETSVSYGGGFDTATGGLLTTRAAMVARSYYRSIRG